MQLEFIEGNCVQCESCVRKCPTGVKPHQDMDSRECIMCLSCLDACHFGALSFGVRRPPVLPKKRTATPVEASKS